jgi:hypothetical protein
VAPDVANLVRLAELSESVGRRDEAAGYWQRILELDVDMPRAWIGKGAAVGAAQSSEPWTPDAVLTCFERAFSLAPGDARLRELAAAETARYCLDQAGRAKARCSASGLVEEVWFSIWVLRLAKLIDLLQKALAWHDHLDVHHALSQILGWAMQTRDDVHELALPAARRATWTELREHSTARLREAGRA